MPRTVTVSLADLEGIPHGANAGTSVTIEAAYTSEVVLLDGTIIPAAKKVKGLLSNGVREFSITRPSERAEPYRNVGVRFTTRVKNGLGARKEAQWERVVIMPSTGTDPIALGNLIPAENVAGAQWMTVEGVLEQSQEIADQAAAQGQQLLADSATTRAAAASASADAKAAAALVGTPTEATVQAVTAGSMLASSTAAALRATTDDVGVNVLSATRLRLHAKVAEGQVWSQDLCRIPAGSYVGPAQPPWLMDAATLAVTTPAPPGTIGTTTWVDETDSTVTHTGSAFQWTTATADARAYGGGYRYTATTGERVDWTTPAATVQISMSVLANVNGGYGLVTIDGSTTAATSLPTAQAEADAGRLPAAALVAGGGTLNPTDRVLDFYAASSLWDDRRILATGLSPAAHTVRITATGYKRGIASQARIFSSGYGSAPYAAVGSSTTTTHTLFPQGAAYSAYEYALDVESADGTQHEFVGNVHGYDQQTSVACYVDGQPVDLATLGDRNGREVVIIRESTLTSPHLTGTVATAKVAYRLTRDGLDVRTRVTMAQACTIRGGYLAMYPVDNGLRRGVLAGVPAELDLTAGTGGAAGGIRARSQTALAYNPDTGVAACMWLPDLEGVSQWRNSSTTQGGLFIEDRAGNVLNKMYAAIVSPDKKRQVAAGEVLTGRTIYRAMRLPDVPTMIGR